MKKYLKIKTILLSSIVFLGMLAMVSCEKYLDKAPESTISETEAFKNFRNFQGFTEELYACIPDFTNGYWTNSWNWGDDEIQSTSYDFHFICKVDNGNFWGWQAEFDGWGAGWLDKRNWNTDPTGNGRFNKGLWPLAWYGIRKANIGLANMDKLIDATDEERNLIKGQLLFFRGWFHFMLIQYFGGLPYIDQVLPSDQKLTLSRLSYSECADKAAADFRAAADLLPSNWDNTTAGKATLGKNQLRINKIMALGYLGKDYLWAGSPLMNYESTGSKTYNADYCKKAAAAFAELLKLCDSGDAPYKLMTFKDYWNNFYTTGQNWSLPGGTEGIFIGPYSSANSTNWGTSKEFMPAVVSEGDLKFVPCANYVDYYGMANGLPIKDITQADPQSGYDPSYPWRNRDPRFYNDFIYDGVKVVVGAMPADQEQHRYANLWYNSVSDKGSYRDERQGSRTGYVLHKFEPATANKYDLAYNWGGSLHIQIPYMRLADIYLMYAEAALMGYNDPNGKDPDYGLSAVDAVNIIRDRAGVAHVNNQFLGSVDAFLPELRRERAVELSYEGHRFNDLRRWLLLTERPYTLKTDVEFSRSATYNTADPTLNKVFNLHETVLVERKFSQKHYWLPLKNADVNLYLEFKQNPGW